MATNNIETTQDIYQLNVTLLGTDPPIWRRLLVPAAMTLAQLHNVLQTSMGWDDGHMHEFRAGQRRFGLPEPTGPLMSGPRAESERKTRLSAVLLRGGANMIYTYDFGDSWEHSILLEKRLPPEPLTTYPVCIDGQRACPPEDCGGIPGYYDLLDVLADSSHPRYEELRDWIGDDFNPEAFSVEKINRIFSSPRRRNQSSAR